MKKLLSSTTILMFLITLLSGCGPIGEKSASQTIIYGATAVCSLLLLIGYFSLVRKRDKWFILLFSSVLVVNIGYFFLAISSTLEQALMANRIAYLGSVFLPMSMLFIILNVTKIEYNKHFSWLLFGISIFVFLVAASPGILDIYYKEVSFKIVNGVSTLVKDYGGWHSLYLFYLIGYFGSMVAIIIRAAIKKTIDSTAHAVIIAIAVFVNICVWFVEQIVTIDFEMLSISYIISELFLLGVHLVMNENQKLKDMVQQVQTVQNFTKIENTTANSVLEIPVQSDAIDTERFTIFINGVNQLTATEKAIYEAYIARMTTKEIMAYLNIKENTLKFHNKNLYSKLGVTSRKELVEVYKQISSVKEKI